MKNREKMIEKLKHLIKSYQCLKGICEFEKRDLSRLGLLSDKSLKRLLDGLQKSQSGDYCVSAQLIEVREKLEQKYSDIQFLRDSDSSDHEKSWIDMLEEDGWEVIFPEEDDEEA